MGKARPIEIRTRTFAKAGEATAHFSEILNRYAIGERILDSDALDLAALIERHDEQSEKVGCGISHFSVNAAPDYPGQRCFWITRTDGTHIDWSYQQLSRKKALRLRDLPTGLCFTSLLRRSSKGLLPSSASNSRRCFEFAQLTICWTGLRLLSHDAPIRSIH